MKCFLFSIYYNIRYVRYGMLNGLVFSGHDYEYTGEIHYDHWEMKCKVCGEYVGSEIGPGATIEELK